MTDLTYDILCSRILTPLQDCKLCMALDPKRNPEENPENCKAHVMENFDEIILDAEAVYDDEHEKVRKAKLEAFILLAIELKKKCFECNRDKSLLFLLYEEIEKSCKNSTSLLSTRNDGEKKTFLKPVVMKS